MKKIVAALIIFAIPKIAYAQEDFSMSGEVKVKQFVVMNEPDLMKTDYSGYDTMPDQEVSLSGHFQLWGKLRLDAYPYFWYSNENKIARVGLFGEFRYDLFGDWLDVGFGHHSWHNADEISVNANGRSQDWFFVVANLWSFDLGDHDRLSLFLKPQYFVSNDEPAELKTIYDGDEATTYAKISLGAKLNYGKLTMELWPYAEFADGPDRYGLKAEVSYPLYKAFSAFGDLHYFYIDGEDRWMIGIGISIKFK